MKIEEIKQEYLNKFCWIGCGYTFKPTSYPLDVFTWISNKLKSTKRTTKANRLYWLWMKCLEDNTGESKDKFHEFFKYEIIGTRTDVDIKGRLIIKEPSTAGMLSKPFNEYMNKVQVIALTEFNVTLPLPEDLGYDEFLEHYKDYL